MKGGQTGLGRERILVVRKAGTAREYLCLAGNLPIRTRNSQP